eukprot:gb/GFBE01011806.1/.p1 GENE.gb/GFBE01011806.1/~~gb/GFBE01011806.1/.p1  ORF type:complete len:135 (+),score=14.08 gb/GFBE01011806.1/:1-405(+)
MQFYLNSALEAIHGSVRLCKYSSKAAMQKLKIIHTRERCRLTQRDFMRISPFQDKLGVGNPGKKFGCLPSTVALTMLNIDEWDLVIALCSENTELALAQMWVYYLLAIISKNKSKSDLANPLHANDVKCACGNW